MSYFSFPLVAMYCIAFVIFVFFAIWLGTLAFRCRHGHVHSRNGLMSLHWLWALIALLYAGCVGLFIITYVLFALKEGIFRFY